MDEQSRNAISELELQEQLFAAMLTGPLLTKEALLEKLVDIDVMIGNQRTLLQLAVFLGKLDWVQKLLELGAEPLIKNGSGYDSLSIAEIMCAKHPKNSDRTEILRQVIRVHADQWHGASSSIYAPHNAKIINNTKVLDELTSNLSNQMNVLNENPIAMPTDSEEPKKQLGHKSIMSEQVKGLSDLMTDIKIGVSKLTQQVSLLEYKGKGKKDVLVPRFTSPEILEMTKEPLTDIESHLNSEKYVYEERIIASEDSNKEGDVSKMSKCLIQRKFASLFEENALADCIKGMMSRTEILNEDESNVSGIRNLYETLYTCSAQTRCLLKYLQHQTELRILVDPQSLYIARMTRSVLGHDGREHNGNQYRSFADFAEAKIYLGGKVFQSFEVEYLLGWFAMTLAQMTMYLAFNNCGRPYAADDDENRKVYQNIVQEAEVAVLEMGGEYGIMYDAIRQTTMLAKEIHLIAAVPQLFAAFGWARETIRMIRYLPSLLNYYEDFVMVFLHQKSIGLMKQ